MDKLFNIEITNQLIRQIDSINTLKFLDQVVRIN